MAPVAIVTGATSGIGTEIARGLAETGHQLILSCRSVNSGERLLKEIHRTHPQSIISIRNGLELDDLDAVQHWADKIKEELNRSKLKISVLVCNAGLMHAPFKLTKDQIETHMQVNHLSHYLLIRELEELLKGGRVVFTSSSLYKKALKDVPLLCKGPECPDYYEVDNGMQAYAQSKMVMNRCALGLTTIMPDTTFIVTSPGMVRTNLSRNFAARSWTNTFLVNTLWHGLGRFLLHSPTSGAAPGIKASTDNNLKSGSYLTQKGLEEFEENCLDQELITEAIKKSDELIKTIRHHSVL